MKNIRVIPRLDMKGPNVVKPVQTEALRVVGNPRELAQRYYQQGADELLYLDIVASLYQRSIDFDLLKQVTHNIFIPCTVGGGIRSLQDINNVLRSGADKVAINTYAISHPEFINEAVKEFGAQCIVASIEAKRQPGGRWEAYTDGGRERTGRDAVEWAQQVIKLGAGEILLTSIDADGTRNGYDLELIKAVTAFSPVPVVPHGGAGTLSSLLDVLTRSHADAVCLSSLLHYNNFTIGEIKKYLTDNSINVRSV